MVHMPYGPYEAYIKRPLDFCLSLGALIVLSPILCVTALLVKTKLGSPVIFKQPRPGKDEKIFNIYKFRTMTDERDNNGELLPDTERLTKFGKILRATSIDELPELINILKGDMAVVGPRPLATIYLDYYTNSEHHRHDVRPGLTGMAQANGRNSIAWEKKFEYDLQYVNNVSFMNDVDIVMKTVKKVFIRDGIGQGEQAPGSLHILRKDWLDTNGNIKPEYNK